ncbi:MAG: hypothetical protein M3347_04840 [Armatimonadota bacterium]|nr:hypothetical protein [Armatimonadota bacterium]
MESEALPDFTGKVVLFYLTNGPLGADLGVLLEDITFQMQAGRLFVAGRSTDMEDKEEEWNWASDVQSGVAWEEVCCYQAFSSRDDYLARHNHHIDTNKPQVKDELEPKADSRTTGNRMVGWYAIAMSIAIPCILVVALIIWILKMLQIL